MRAPLCLSILLLVGMQPLLSAIDSPPGLTSIVTSNQQTRVQFDLYPATQQYKMLKSPDLEQPFEEDLTGQFFGKTWTAPGTGPLGFYRLEAVPLDRNLVLTTTVLNRLAYGPTPDELARVKAIGPQNYIQEQLAPEGISEQLSFDVLGPTIGDWQYVTATGSGSSSTLYIYLNSRSGQGYLDDVQLVAGTAPGVGANLLRNGNFEAPLTTNDWVVSPNLVGSVITTEAAHSGTSSLKLITSAPGTTESSAIWQKIAPALSSSKQYTLSFWYRPIVEHPSSVTVRLSGSGIVGSSGGSLLNLLANREADIDTLRSWHVRRAIESKRQLLEVLLQFCENHFVTQYSKSQDYFGQFYSSPETGRLATDLEFRENTRWREALLNPNCTFYDLLKISAESPAMIIYLDTVTSRGDGNPPRIANENYARELLELFTFGVNNGYDQNDIVEISKAWTGWRVELLAATNQFNPLAPRLVDLNPSVKVTNLVGVWTFNYQANRHNGGTKTIFPGKVVPNRFGPPYAGRNYELDLPARTGTNGIQDGYDIITHLANQPFTQEFISVKLCRLFVHDNFDIGYDFTDPNLSPEGQLVRRCMDAWENSSPKGQVRAVLSTIFHSELFQGNAASMQKVKTPLEFTVSAIRALRATKPDGSFTAESDGNLGIILNRMGGMNLFDRVEPNGYPEVAAPWVSAGTLDERLRFVQAFLIAKGQSGRSDAGNNDADPVALLRTKLPDTALTSAEAVTDCFLSNLYPAEGAANLALYRSSAIQFLNTADNGTTPSPFGSLAPTSATYDTRVRGMVAMLMTLQRFQEQ